MTRACTCRHCSTPTTVTDERPEPEPIELPATPTPIRVHQPDARPLDCALHPDGRLTMTRPNGEVLTNMLTFAEMQERNWATAHIEFDPQPLEAEPEPEAAPVAEQIQFAA